MAGDRKPGTRPKGDRRAITLRVPRGYFDAYDQARDAAGFKNMSDYLNAVVARAHSLQPPAYATPGEGDSGQQQLALELQAAS